MAKKAEMRREQIIKAAFQAAYEQGYESVTLQEIADYAGVSKGVTNYYFKNKQDVFTHLFEWLTNKIFEKEITWIETQETALEKLNAYISQVFISPEENRKFYRVYLDFLAQTRNSEPYKQINQTFYANCHSIGESIIQQGIEEEVFSVENVEQSSVSMRCMIDGSMLQWLMKDDDELHAWYRKICHESIIQLLNGSPAISLEND